MILSGHSIADAHADGSIIIEPFNPDQITTNSYDFRLGPTILQYEGSILDCRYENHTVSYTIPNDGLLLRAGELYLGHTLERMGSTRFVPMIKGRSGVARLGLFIHATADLIDIGSVNQWTLQLIPTLDIKIYPGMRIGQVTFWEVTGSIRHYSGKYQDSKGPMPSMIHLDMPYDEIYNLDH